MRQDEQDPNSRPQLSTPGRYTMDSSQLYPYHLQQAFVFSSPPITPPGSPHHVHQHRSMTITPPPIPPKPIVYSTLNPNATREDYQVSPSPPPLPLPPLLPSTSQSSPPLLPPLEDEVSDELAMVLALSQSESIQKRLLEEQLINQEEEDLARALAASMLPSESNFQSPTNGIPESKNTAYRIQSTPYHIPLVSPPISLPSLVPSGLSEESSGPSMSHDPYAELGRYDKWRIPNRPENQQEIAPKNLELQPNVVRSESPSLSSVSLLPLTSPSPRLVKRSSTSSISSLPYNMPEPRLGELPKYLHNVDGDRSSSQETSFPGHPIARGVNLSSEFLSPDTILEFDDAAYARQLASDEDKILKQLNQSLYIEEGQQDYFVDQTKSSSTFYGKQNVEWHHPQLGRTSSRDDDQYPQDARASLSPAITSTTVPASGPLMQSAYSLQDYSFPPIGRVNSYQPDNFQETRKASIQFSPITYPSLRSRRGSVSDTQSETSQTSSPLPHNDRPHLHLDMLQRSAEPAARRDSQSLPPQQTATTITPNQRRPSTGVLNVNQFVDHDLLCGVSIGFKSPMISSRMIQMQEQMPNIISLPYSRCPPLHIQAPDWRHLLRLMARLSGTRIEPTVEAMAVSKADLKLRTVIQFVKPHPRFDDWRSVLWFTIDQPVPPSAPSASRYTSGNPNLLPWSYTLSAIPLLLRDASDTNMSKTYTIPATDTIPLPTLPVTFPNLALYLQAALDTSRRHLSDSPNGLGKLGKMVQVCYPNVNEGDLGYDNDVPERTRVSHYFKRVIGRSNKDKRKGKGTNNEDTYQLVTPFVPDEWG